VPSQKNETILKGVGADKSKQADLIQKKVENITTKINSEIHSNRIQNFNHQSQNSSQYIETILQENELLKEQNMLLRKQLEIKVIFFLKKILLS
jgi:hypothetical protein